MQKYYELTGMISTYKTRLNFQNWSYEIGLANIASSFAHVLYRASMETKLAKTAEQRKRTTDLLESTISFLAVAGIIYEGNLDANVL